MEENILFSIVIPTYNNLDLLKRALNSVLKQKGVKFEIIIVDDSTAILIEEYVIGLNNTNIRYFHNKPSLGAVPNWNYGLSLTKGDYVILLHHDEAFDSEEHLLSLTKVMSNCDISVSNVIVYVEDKERRNLIIKYFRRLMLAFPIISFILNAIGPTACLCIKKDSIIPFNENLKWLVDVEWYYRLLKKNKCHVTNLNILSTFGHAGQITKKIDIRETEKQDIQEIETKYRNQASVRCMVIARKILRMFT